MALGSPTLLGSATGASKAGLTLAVTTTAAVAVGDTVLVFVGTEGTNTTTTVTDSAGNTYVTSANSGLNTGQTVQRIFQCVGATAPLPIGGTITATWTLAFPAKAMIAIGVPGVIGIDQQPPGTTATSATPNGVTGLLANNNEIVFAQGVAFAGNTETLTESFGFSTVVYQPMGAGALWVSFAPPQGPTAVSYAASLSASDTWGIKLMALEGPALSTAFAAVSGPTYSGLTPAPPRVVTRYGYYNTQSESLTFVSGNLIGVNLGRYNCNTTVPGAGSGAAADYAAAGWVAGVILANAPIVADVVTFTNGSALIAGTNLPYGQTQTVTFTTTGSLPTNFATNTTYYILAGGSPAGITVSATVDGSPVVAGSAGSGVQTLNAQIGPNPIPTDMATWSAQVTAGLITNKPFLAIYQTEEDNGVFVQTQCADVNNPYLNPTHADPQTFNATAQATAQAYMAALTTATAAAHALGYKITNGGTSMDGLYFSYWYYLYSIGRQDLADQFANVCLSPITQINVDYRRYLPSEQNPNVVPFAARPAALLHMLTCQAMLPLYRFTGIDYWNVHIFNALPDDEQPLLALQWAQGIVGLPPIMSAMGTRNANTLTMTAVATIAQVMNMPIAMAFDGGSGNQKALALADPNTGALTASGVAYQQVVATYG